MHLLSALRTTRRKGVLGRPQPPSHLVYRGLIIVTRENARSAADEECGAVLVRQHGIIFADVAVDCYRHIIAERGPQFAHTPSRMGNPALAGEPGFDRHHQEVRQGQVKYRSEGGERVDGDARCHPGLGNRRCKSKRVRFCFDVKIIHFRAGFRERSYVVGGVADHHMNMKRQLSGSSKGSYCAGPEREVWDEMPIHDVDVDGVHTGIFELSRLLAQGTEIRAHDGGRNMGRLQLRVVGHFCGALKRVN